MIWKAIGCSVCGTSHHALEKGCEDALAYLVVTDPGGAEVLIACVADGAGSAQHAASAAELATRGFATALDALVAQNQVPEEAAIFRIAEQVYETLCAEAEKQDTALQEWSCTVLGCCLYPALSVFFQVGDGAIVRSDALGYYHPVWWPDNKEYQNVTSFLTDDPLLKDFKVCIIREAVDEVAIFTDGLQMLALQFSDETAYQPFFAGLFPGLRAASGPEQVAQLNSRLATYLDCPAINERTDDDKTLFLATRRV